MIESNNGEGSKFSETSSPTPDNLDVNYDSWEEERSALLLQASSSLENVDKPKLLQVALSLSEELTVSNQRVTELEQELEDTKAKVLSDSSHNILLDAARTVIEERRDRHEIVEEHKRINEELEAMRQAALFDDLTGALTRLGFASVYEKHVAADRLQGVPTTLLFIDLDKFKPVNDIHGHDRGDKVLVDIVDRIRRRLRESDALCRHGGDELLVLLPATSIEIAATVAEELRTIVMQLSKEEKFEPPVTTSIGICPVDSNSIMTDSINKADLAMYSAKQNGGNQIAFCKEPS